MTPKEKALFLELRMLKGFICGLDHVSYDKGGVRHILKEIRAKAKEIKDELEDEEVVKESFTTEREWVGLTEYEIQTIEGNTRVDDFWATKRTWNKRFAEAIENNLKRKNT